MEIDKKELINKLGCKKLYIAIGSHLQHIFHIGRLESHNNKIKNLCSEFLLKEGLEINGEYNCEQFYFKISDGTDSDTQFNDSIHDKSSNFRSELGKVSKFTYYSNNQTLISEVSDGQCLYRIKESDTIKQIFFRKVNNLIEGKYILSSFNNWGKDYVDLSIGHKGGKILCEIDYEKGIPNGYEIIYGKNEIIYSKVGIINGKYHGTQNIHLNNGSLFAEYCWINGYSSSVKRDGYYINFNNGIGYFKFGGTSFNFSALRSSHQFKIDDPSLDPLNIDYESVYGVVSVDIQDFYVSDHLIFLYDKLGLTRSKLFKKITMIIEIDKNGDQKINGKISCIDKQDKLYVRYPRKDDYTIFSKEKGLIKNMINLGNDLFEIINEYYPLFMTNRELALI